jgi:pimeloyl-ACP methyl ester carboxylesterase
VPAVFVHGVPETTEIWQPLVGALARDDIVTLALPGFGRQRPEGFGATKEDYVAWLIDALEGLADVGPVDLVGHDWGGALVARAASQRADLLASWATDAAGICTPEFKWHDLALIWQTPGEGEAFWDGLRATSNEEQAAGLEAYGVPHEAALAMSAQVDETMVECILTLYRSALDVGAEWSPDFVDLAAPGLSIIATEDPFGVSGTAASAAHKAGAETVTLEGLGHWWMLQDPAAGAAMLEAFWSR